MRALNIIGWVVMGIAGVAAIALLVGFGVQFLWNWLIPDIFGLGEITFWQAVGLFVLIHILFGGHHAHHSRSEKKGGWWKFRERLHGELCSHNTQSESEVLSE